MHAPLQASSVETTFVTIQGILYKIIHGVESRAARALRSMRLWPSNCHRATFCKPITWFMIGGLLACAEPAAGGLSAEHRVALTQNLDALSERWDQAAVDSANRILSTSSYTRVDWQDFFAAYFSERPLTDDLVGYLGYPVLYWLSEPARIELQEGLAPVLFDRFQSLVEANRAALGQALWRDKRLRQNVFNLHFLSANIPSVGLLSPATRASLYSKYRTLIEQNRDFFGSSKHVDVLAQYSLGLLRAQVQAAFTDIMPLTPEVKREIATVLGLSGLHAQVWTDHSVLLIDNLQLASAQVEFVHSLLRSVPPAKHSLRFITVHDFLANSDYGVLLRKGADGALNYRLQLNPRTNAVSFDFDRSLGGPSPRVEGVVPSHQWSHVAGVYDGERAKLFIDGNEVASIAATGPAKTSADPLHLGRDVYPARGQFYRGLMDDVRVYRRALSEAEIKALATGKPVSNDALAASYDMEGSGGVSLLDSSGNGNHGTLHNVERVDGYAGAGLSFNGKTSVAEIPTGAALASSNAFTVSLFMRASEEGRVLRSSSWMVNIAGMRIGEFGENGFPSDVEPHMADVFSLIAAHEFNHVIDVAFVEGCPVQNVKCSPSSHAARKKQLLSQAGNDSMQYLRSMVGGAFFQAAPQEFFASISNQYFANTERTLQLAVARYRAGFKEPMNQFLWFAEVQSWDNGTIPFFTFDTRGVLSWMGIPFTRDSAGRIAAFNLGEQHYSFDRDEEGNLRSLTVGSGLRSVGRFPHLASGGGWSSSVTVVNQRPQVSRASFRVRSGDGRDLQLPLQSAELKINGVMPGLEFLIPAYGTVTLSTAADSSGPALTGWAELATDGDVVGSLVFGLTHDDGRVSEAVVGLETRTSLRMVLPFNNESGFATGIALANHGLHAISVEILARDEEGRPIGTGYVDISSGGHSAFDAAVRFGFLAGRKGTLEVRSQDTPISLIGIRFNPKGSFTTIPVVPR